MHHILTKCHFTQLFTTFCLILLFTTQYVHSGNYIKLRRGASGCPPGQKILSKAECRRAHDALGLKRNLEWTGRTGSIPAGCIWRDYGNHNFHWNTAHRGRGRSDLFPVCKKPKRSSKYKILRKGARGCPRGQKIGSRAECRRAHDALGLKRSSEWTGRTRSIPAGCIWRDYGNHNFHWNTARRGRGRSDLHPICKKRIKHRKLRCPRGTRTIGRQGQKNDIGGCGLGGCHSRYRVNSITRCLRKCGKNKRCKSFSWAPNGGDRNHRDRNVCTIYDSRRANNKWGPNQIMCGKPKKKRKKRKKRKKLVRKRRRKKKRKARKRWACVTLRYKDRELRKCIRRRRGRRGRRRRRGRFGSFRRSRAFRRKPHGYREGYRMGRRVGMNAARMGGMSRGGMSRGGMSRGGLSGLGGLGGMSGMSGMSGFSGFSGLSGLRSVNSRMSRPPRIRLIDRN